MMWRCGDIRIVREIQNKFTNLQSREKHNVITKPKIQGDPTSVQTFNRYKHEQQ